jgi:hypothetical protein
MLLIIKYPYLKKILNIYNKNLAILNNNNFMEMDMDIMDLIMIWKKYLLSLKARKKG